MTQTQRSFKDVIELKKPQSHINANLITVFIFKERPLKSGQTGLSNTQLVKYLHLIHIHKYSLARALPYLSTIKCISHPFKPVKFN